MRVPWTARRSNQSILKKISPEYSLEELMLKLKLQYFGHLIGRANSMEKTLMLGKIEGKRRRGVAEDEIVRQHHLLKGHEFEQKPSMGYMWRNSVQVKCHCNLRERTKSWIDTALVGV